MTMDSFSKRVIADTRSLSAFTSADSMSSATADGPAMVADAVVYACGVVTPEGAALPYVSGTISTCLLYGIAVTSLVTTVSLGVT